MEWISVKDRLPDVLDNYSEICLVTDGKSIGLARRYKEYEFDHWSESYYIGSTVDYKKITHWMLMPKPK